MRILAPIVAAVLLATPVFASKATDVYHKAQKLEKRGKIIEAYLAYSEAAMLDPKNKAYQAKTVSLQARAVLMQAQSQAATQAQKAAAAAAAKPAAPDADAPDADKVEPDPDPDYVNISSREVERARRMLPPPQVKLASGRFDFHVSATQSDVFTQVAGRCGLSTVFDGEYSMAGAKIRFDIEDVDCREALRAVEAATSSFVVPISSKLIMVSKDTTAKRTANEQTMSVVIPVPNALTTQDLTEIAQAVKQVAGIDKLAWNAASNEIVIRDRVSRVMIALPLVEQLTAYRAAVLFDLRFLQLSDQEMLSYGVNLTNTFSFIWSGDANIAKAGAALNLVLKALEHGTQAFGISALQASVVANLTQSSARTVLRTQIASVNGLPATFHVGDKYPILTSGYFGPASSTSSAGGTAYTPPPSFTYQDLGVSLKILPVVGSSDLITLDVDSEYQLLAGQSIDGIPVIANRKFSTRISLHNDEWAIIGGLMDKTDNTSISGVAGLARLPLIGWLFKTQTREKDRDHIVIVMKPHLTGEPPSSHETAPMRVGTETRPLSPI